MIFVNPHHAHPRLYYRCWANEYPKPGFWGYIQAKRCQMSLYSTHVELGFIRVEWGAVREIHRRAYRICLVTSDGKLEFDPLSPFACGPDGALTSLLLELARAISRADAVRAEFVSQKLRGVFRIYWAAIALIVVLAFASASIPVFFSRDVSLITLVFVLGCLISMTLARLYGRRVSRAVCARHH